MGNRSRFVVISAAAAAAAALATRRRSRLRNAAEGIERTIMPTRAGEWFGDLDAPDEAHAPGHRHVGPASRAGRVLDQGVFAHRRSGHGQPFSSE